MDGKNDMLVLALAMESCTYKVTELFNILVLLFVSYKVISVTFGWFIAMVPLP
jgi:hypothetical protein